MIPSIPLLALIVHESPGEIIGWRVRNYANAGAWTIGTFSLLVAAGEL